MGDEKEVIRREGAFLRVLFPFGDQLAGIVHKEGLALTGDKTKCIDSD